MVSGRPNGLAHASTQLVGPERTRLKSGSMGAGPTYASHFSVVSQTLGRPSESSAVRFARSKHGPNNACILVGDCHRGTVEAAPLPKLVDPLVVEIGFAGRRSHDRAGAMDEQSALFATNQSGSFSKSTCKVRAVHRDRKSPARALADAPEPTVLHMECQSQRDQLGSNSRQHQNAFLPVENHLVPCDPHWER
jgi:hypothetical protein